MGTPLRVLIIEDSEDDALLVVRELRRHGYDPTFERVDSVAGFGAALDRRAWDVVIADYSMPGFDGLTALKLLRERDVDVPFVIVSGTIGEETAVEAMKAGAHDYVLKDSLARLGPAVRRELDEAEGRRERRRAEQAQRLYAERLETLHEIDQAILTAQSSAAIAQAVLARIRRLIPCHRASVALFDWEREEVTVLAVHTNGETKVGTGAKIPLGRFGPLDGLQAGEVFLVDDLHVATDLSPLVQELAAEGVRSYINIPLISQDTLIGSLNLGAERPGLFGQEQIEIAREVAAPLAVAIQNAWLLEAERQRSAELEALHQASLHVTSSLELQPVLEAIIEHALRLVLADDAHIFLYDGERLTFGAAMWAGNLQRKPFATPRPGGLTYAVARAGKQIVVPDVNCHPLFENWRWGGAIIGLPLSIGEQVVGVMTVAFDQPHPFTAEEVRILTLLADQAAIAVENARLFQARERQSRQLALLADVARTTAAVLDPNQLLLAVAESIYHHFGSPIVELYTIEGGGQKLVLRGYRGPQDEDLDVLTPGRYEQPIEVGIVGLVARTGQPYLSVDVNADPTYYTPIEVGTTSELCVPIVEDDHVVGVVNVESDRPAAFDEGDQSLLEAVATTVSVGLRNARLHTETQRRVQELTLLNHIAVGFGASMDMDGLIEGALDGLKELVGTDRTYFITTDPDNRTWETTHERVAPGITPNVGLSGSFDDVPGEQEALLNGQTFAVSDVSTDPRIEQSREMYRSLGVQSILLVPLRARGRLHGVLGFDYCRQQHDWQPDDIRLLEGVAHQLELALENVWLFEELRRHAQDLAVALTRQEELDRLKGELIQNVSHELRQPLALIRGYAELFDEGELGPLQPQQQDAAEIIARRTRMLSDLVEDITLILSMEARPLDLEPVALDALARAAVKDFRVAADQAGLILKSDIEPDLPPVQGEGITLRRVLDNLLTNAIKFTPAGGSIDMRLWQEDENVRLQVSDTGIGIPVDQQEHIFERFYQVDGSARRRYGGVGLGLALVKEIVEALGGTVEVESEVGKGSTFTVSLPIAEM